MGFVLNKRSADRLRNLSRKETLDVSPRRDRSRGAAYFATSTFPARSGGSSIAAATVSGTTTTYQSGDVILERDNGTALVADGETVTAYNRMKKTIPANTAVWLGWWGGKYWILGYECP